MDSRSTDEVAQLGRAKAHGPDGSGVSSAQLFRTGLVHADPHEGNMLFTDDGKLALLDFGLICRVDDDQQEAMANCILNILNSQWGELIDNLRIMDMLPEEPQMWIDENGNQADYTQGGPGSWKVISDDEFRRAFEVCMDGEEGNPKVRANFTELVLDLTKISTAYRFNFRRTWFSSFDRSRRWILPPRAPTVTCTKSPRRRLFSAPCRRERIAVRRRWNKCYWIKMGT